MSESLTRSLGPIRGRIPCNNRISFLAWWGPKVANPKACILDERAQGEEEKI